MWREDSSDGRKRRGKRKVKVKRGGCDKGRDMHKERRKGRLEQKEVRNFRNESEKQ